MNPTSRTVPQWPVCVFAVRTDGFGDTWQQHSREDLNGILSVCVGIECVPGGGGGCALCRGRRKKGGELVNNIAQQATGFNGAGTHGECV